MPVASSSSRVWRKIRTEPLPPSAGLVSPTRSRGLYAPNAVPANARANALARPEIRQRAAIPQR
jgi:hypothetical protein